MLRRKSGSQEESFRKESNGWALKWALFPRRSKPRVFILICRVREKINSILQKERKVGGGKWGMRIQERKGKERRGKGKVTEKIKKRKGRKDEKL